MCVLGSKKLLGTIDGDSFNDVDVFTSSVPPTPGVTFGILISQHRTLCFHHAGRSKIFGSDQFDVVALAMFFRRDGIVDNRVCFGNPAA